jgi:hypothetical protein
MESAKARPATNGISTSKSDEILRIDIVPSFALRVVIVKIKMRIEA